MANSMDNEMEAGVTLNPKPWVLPPLSNSWMIVILWLYIALNRTPTIACHWVGAVPNLKPKS